MDNFIKYLIYTHAFFGGIGLVTGISILFIKKGTALHKTLGKIFSIGMLISAIISIPVCMLPKHENLFLALIGFFSIYLIITGNRAIRLKNKIGNNTDYFISYFMVSISIIMIFIGIIGILKGFYGNLLYLFFGVVGLRLAIGDFTLYKNKQTWLRSHIGKMLGALIASITAFMVAGLQINSIWAWIVPSVIGTIYIYYWIRKIR